MDNQTFSQQLMILSLQLPQQSRGHYIRWNGNADSLQLQVNIKINIPIWWHTMQVCKKNIHKLIDYRDRLSESHL